MGVRPSKSGGSFISEPDSGTSSSDSDVNTPNSLELARKEKAAKEKVEKQRQRAERKTKHRVTDVFYRDHHPVPFSMSELPERTYADTNHSGSAEEPLIQAKSRPLLVHKCDIRACELCDLQNANTARISVVEQMIVHKESEINVIAARLKDAQESLRKMKEEEMGMLLTKQDEVHRARNATMVPNEKEVSHFFRVGAKYTTHATCNQCTRVVALRPYITQLSEDIYKVIFEYLAKINPNARQPTKGLRLSCKAMYNMFLPLKPEIPYRLVSVKSKVESDTFFTSFTRLTMEVRPNKGVPIEQYGVSFTLIMGSERYQRPFFRTLYFAKVEDSMRRGRPLYRGEMALYDSIFFGDLYVGLFTNNAYGQAISSLKMFKCVKPVAVVHDRASYQGRWDGSCVAAETVVYVALTDEWAERTARDTGAEIVVGELAREEAGGVKQEDSVAEEPRRIRFIKRAVGLLNEGDVVLSSHVGGPSDVIPSDNLASGVNENPTIADTEAPVLRKVKTSNVRLVTHKPVHVSQPIVRVDEFLITKGHPLMCAGEWVRPDEAWPVIDTHVTELCNLFLDPLPTFVVGERRWVCGGLGGYYARVAELNRENDERFGRGFKKRFEAQSIRRIENTKLVELEC